jgi:hypothetical protein
MVGLRQAGAFLLKSKFVRALPLTLSSARGVTSAEGRGGFPGTSKHWPDEAIGGGADGDAGEVEDPFG